MPEHDEIFDKYLIEKDRANELEHTVNKLELTNRELVIQLDRARELLGNKVLTVNSDYCLKFYVLRFMTIVWWIVVTLQHFLHILL